MTHVCTDDYHRYDRRQRAELGHHAAAPRLQLHRHHRPAPRPSAPRRADPQARLPPPGRDLRRRRSTSSPSASRSSRACSATTRRRCATSTTCASSSNPPEELRRRWKVQRDCSRRGYTTDQVLAELDRREPDSAAYIRPQRRYADMVVSFLPGERRGDHDQLDAELTLREGLPHPDLSPFIDDGAGGITLTERGDERPAAHPGRHRRRARGGRSRRRSGSGCTSPPTCAASGSASSRSDDLHRSESLALVQLLILYHLVTAGGGGAGPRGAGASGIVRPRSTAALASPVRTKRRNSSTAGRTGPCAGRITYHCRLGRGTSTRIVPRSPSSTSRCVASRDCSDTPRPARAACLIAPLEPRVGSAGADRGRPGTPRSSSACRSPPRAAARAAIRAARRGPSGPSRADRRAR